MYKNKTIGVVVPAYNEEKLIGRVIETMPDFVDKIIIVNDCSQDQTAAKIEGYINQPNSRVELISLSQNKGVGGAIVEGYKWCRDQGIEVTAVMAGDAQMDPADLPALLDPVVAGEVDYTKGNRLVSGEAWNKIPRVRYLGNAGLSLLTKIASGYWHIADSQTGYTATNLKVLNSLDLDHIYKRYGMPNDMLVKLNVNNFVVRDIEITPIYAIGESSGINPIRIIPKMSWLLLKLFILRMVQKYVIRDFHPLVFFYFLATMLLIISIPLAIRILYFVFILGLSIPRTNTMIFVFVVIMGMQLLLFAMWFDMEYNRHLR